MKKSKNTVKPNNKLTNENVPDISPNDCDLT